MPGPARVVTVPVLLADPWTGMGCVARLRLVVRPGGGTIASVDRRGGTRFAAGVAVAISAALGNRLARWTVLWELLDLPPGIGEVDGDSVGLAAAIGALAAVEGREIPPDCAFTGVVHPDGSVAEVADLVLKARAARDQGLPRLWAPPGAAAVLSGRSDLATASEVTSVDALARRLWPPARLSLPPALWAAGALLLGPLLGQAGLLDPVDHSLRAMLLQSVSAPLPAENTAIIAVDPVRTRGQRGLYPALMRALTALPVRSITFDLDFADAQEADPELALAASEARRAGVPVILGLSWRSPTAGDGSGEGRVLPESPALRDALASGDLRPGLAQVEGEGLADLQLGRVPLRAWSPASDWVWSLGLVTVDAWTAHGPPPTLQDGVLRVGGTRNLVRGVSLYLAPCARPPELTLGQPLPASFAGRAVLIGALASGDRFGTPDGERYGVELHAALIETVAAGRAPVMADPDESAVLDLGAVGATLLLGLGWRTGPGLVARAVYLVPLFAAVGVTVGLARTGLLIDLCPLLISIGFALAALTRLRAWMDRT